MKNTAIIFVLLIIMATNSHAIPQFSMLTGNKCLNCHVSPQGGNIRNELGFYAVKDNSLIKPESVGLGGFHETFGKTNTYFDGLLGFGFDVRYESAELGGSLPRDRKYFWMQASPYIVVKPLKWLSAGGHYNFVEPLYLGQKRWSAYVIVQPEPLYPYLRAGFIQPSIGIRYDDHTVLIRQTAGQARSIPLIAPDYAEYGAEIGFEGFKWLSVTAGVFGSKSMSEILINTPGQRFEPIVGPKSLISVIKASVLPRFLENLINTNIGGSFLVGGDFFMSNAFAMAGVTDHLSLLTEYMHSDKKDIQTTDNYLVMLTYQLLDGLLLEARIERGSTIDKVNSNNYHLNQYVFGAQIMPLPFIEIRPEYRIFDMRWINRTSSQWTAQAHVFF